MCMISTDICGDPGAVLRSSVVGFLLCVGPLLRKEGEACVSISLGQEAGTSILGVNPPFRGPV
jgi:hypothetical protein